MTRAGHIDAFFSILYCMVFLVCAILIYSIRILTPFVGPYLLRLLPSDIFARNGPPPEPRPVDGCAYRFDLPLPVRLVAPVITGIKVPQ